MVHLPLLQDAIAALPSFLQADARPVSHARCGLWAPACTGLPCVLQPVVHRPARPRAMVCWCGALSVCVLGRCSLCRDPQGFLGRQVCLRRAHGGGRHRFPVHEGQGPTRRVRWKTVRTRSSGKRRGTPGCRAGVYRFLFYQGAVSDATGFTTHVIWHRLEAEELWWKLSRATFRSRSGRRRACGTIEAVQASWLRRMMVANGCVALLCVMAGKEQFKDGPHGQGLSMQVPHNTRDWRRMLTTDMSSHSVCSLSFRIS